MPPLNLLIKPASGRCNMRCRYCFYADETAHREVDDYGLMPEDVLEAMIRKSLAHAEGACTFGFQGGEPTLRGLDFFRRAVELQQKYNVNNVRIDNALQTNGTLINEEWAQFFADSRFLIGLSLDGMAGLHNKNRPDARGEGTLRRAGCRRLGHGTPRGTGCAAGTGWCRRGCGGSGCVWRSGQRHARRRQGRGPP